MDFLANCLQVTLEAKQRTSAGGTTPREVIAKFKTMQRVDVHLPTPMAASWTCRATRSSSPSTGCCWTNGN